jgi:hypothetical protein
VIALQADAGAVLACPRTVLFEQVPDDGALYEYDLALMSDDPATRFIDLLQQIRLNNAMNGVIRRQPLTRVLKMGTFKSADYLLMAELALLGKFLLIPEPMFFRRMSPEAATQRRGELEAERHLDPSAKRARLWQRWRYHLRLLRISCRLPPFGFASWRTFDFAVRRTVWSRGELAEDVRAALSRVFAG